MIKLSRILTVILCCAPAFAYGAGSVATTSGSNLTAYNPSTAYNNQWATISNARYDGDTNARVDFGNCNAVVLRCAQPKCANGGCTDASVAGAIVSGCVKANDSCKKYGDDLVSYMTAQLVANSTAKVQEQAAQSAAAVESMKTAATEAAQQTEAGITSYEQEAIERNIPKDVLVRKQMTGEIMTEVEDAELSLKNMQTDLQNAFKYADCDSRGNNCGVPKRIKKWRELARDFVDHYDNTIDKIYDALDDARMAGVDLSQIYAMLGDSCNSWAYYLCPKITGEKEGATGIFYSYQKNNSTTIEATKIPYVCKNISEWVPTESDLKSAKCKPCTWLKNVTSEEDVYAGWIEADEDADENQKIVACADSSLDVNPFFARRTKNKKGKGIVDIDKLITWLNQVELNKAGYCMCSGNKDELQKAALSKSVNSNELCVVGWSQSGNASTCNIINGTGPCNYDTNCYDNKTDSKVTDGESDCAYIKSTFAICDTHPYNAGYENMEKNKERGDHSLDTEKQEEMNEIIKLKITVLSQQLYKQYEYMNATLRRLKTQLGKAVLTSNLEAAGAKSDGSSSGGGLLGGGTNKDSAVVLSGAINCSYQVDFDRFVDCISGNIQSIIRAADSADKKNACVQLQWDLNSVVSRLTSEGISATNKDNWVNCKTYMTFDADKGLTVNTGKQCTTNGNDKNKIKMCANEIISKLFGCKTHIK